MREAKRWMGYAALLAGPFVAGGSLVVASGLASAEAIIGLVSALAATIGAWAARRDSRQATDDEPPR